MIALPNEGLGIKGRALVVLVHRWHGHGHLLLGHGLQRHRGGHVGHGDGVEVLHCSVRAGRGRGGAAYGDGSMRATATAAGVLAVWQEQSVAQGQTESCVLFSR